MAPSIINSIRSRSPTVENRRPTMGIGESSSAPHVPNRTFEIFQIYFPQFLEPLRAVRLALQAHRSHYTCTHTRYLVRYHAREWLRWFQDGPRKKVECARVRCSTQMADIRFGRFFLKKLRNEWPLDGTCASCAH